MHLVVSQTFSAIRSGRRGRGDADQVADFYERAYGGQHMRLSAETQTRAGRPLPFRVGDRAVVSMATSTCTRFFIDRMSEIVGACEPMSVCEVGCGRGANLMHLADRLPGVQCTGFDVAEPAIRSAREFQAMDDLPSTPFGQSLGLSAERSGSWKSIQFKVGSAFALPAEDRSFDLVYTSAALEQMQSDIARALSELRRVARHYVLMREPFADGNDMLGRMFLWSKNYFRMRSDELPKHGLEPVKMWTSLPVKPTFGYSFLLCRVKP